MAAMEAVFDKRWSCGESHFNHSQCYKAKDKKGNEALNNKTTITDLLLEILWLLQSVNHLATTAVS